MTIRHSIQRALNVESVALTKPVSKPSVCESYYILPADPSLSQQPPLSAPTWKL